MIKKVKLHNIQSHKDTEIEFSNGINSIVGLSDSGKSAFLRGIRALLYRDSFYIRSFCEEGFVEIEFDNATVRREQTVSYPKKCPSCKEKVELVQRCEKCNALIEPSVSSDRYVVNGEIKEKFGAKLPDFIKDVLKFYETKFVDFEVSLNFFSQHEDMFFIGQSYAGGARNKILSCLVPDSDKVDLLLQKVNSEYQEQKLIMEHLSSDNLKLESAIKDGESDYNEIIELHKFISLSEEKLEKLQTSLDRLEYFKKVFQGLSYVKTNVEICNKISENLKKLKLYIENKYNPQVNKLERLKILSNLPKHYKDVKTKIDVKFDFNEIEETLKKINRLKELKLIFDVSETQIERLETEKDVLKSKVILLKSKYNESLGNQRCPVINDKYCDECIERLKI